MLPKTKLLFQDISIIARDRRDEKIGSFYHVPITKESHLPNNLTEFALRSGFYTYEELDIIQSEATRILANVASQKWTSLSVTRAFCKATAYAQQLMNCVTDVLFVEAEARARFLDAYIRHHGRTIGPLHGLPVSLQDSIITTPYPSSLGLAALANIPTEKDTLVVTLLRNLGAVFYVKTNVPQALMMLETDNNVFGPTRNPLHKGLSCGGCAGGEAALIAFRASPLGVGTDVGTGVRLPAAWCHLYGLKPSAGRFPIRGCQTVSPGHEFVVHSLGPISASLQTIRLFCKSLLSDFAAPWDHDPKCLHLPWRENTVRPPGRRLRFGIGGIDDGLVTCHPPVERALQIVRYRLEQAGHEVFGWSTEDHPAILSTTQAAFFDIGGAAITDAIFPIGEPVLPSVQGFAFAAQLGTHEMTPPQMRALVQLRNELQEAYLDRWMATALNGRPAMDGLIMAASPWAAARMNGTQDCPYLGYTGVFSVLDYSACTFPVTHANKNIDRPRDLTGFKPLNNFDKIIQATYDANFTHGAPVSLQMVGRRFEEEKVVEMVEAVMDALRS